MLRRGASFGPYVVVGRIGEGESAAVFRVRHGVLGSVHALKVNSFETEEAKSRLRQEGKHQASVRHPNVVSVTDVVDSGNRTALVMEFVKGPTLRVLLRERTPSLEQSMQLFAPLARGVQAIHAAGLVHRDLKPANVLLASTGGGLVPKVTDFGLAIPLGSEVPKVAGLQGTPQYMAPEQLLQRPTIDVRADLFALGCILYELVAGRPPFDGKNLVAVANSVQSGRYSDPRLWAPDAPDVVVGAIDRLLRVEVAERVPSCEQLLRMLYGGSLGESAVRQPVRLGDVAHRSHLTSQDATVIRDRPSVAPALSRFPAHDPVQREVDTEAAGHLPALLMVGLAGTATLIALVSVVLLAAVWASPEPEPEPEPELDGSIEFPMPPEPEPPRVEAPSPAPEPVAAQPAPEPVAAPEPVVQLTVEGDADVRLLDARGAVVAAGPLQPGIYSWRARFADTGRELQGTITLEAGPPRTLRCSSFAMKCVTR